MKFSIIIPVYNVEKYLKKCLTSILQQNFNDYELILIDDGSTDMSGKICDEFEEKYNNITNEDDYLLCALWSINNIEVEVVNDFIENVYDHVADYNIRTKNGVQGLSNAMILNGSSGHMYRNMEFLLQLQKRDIKIANQFLPLVGVLSNTNPRRTVDLVEGVIEDLCDKEAEYEFYLDKGFRTIFAVVIVSFCTISDKRRYIDELLAHGVISFINSKNKGIFEEALS